MKKRLSLMLAALLMLSAAVFAEEDGQNPVMNIFGPYMDANSQRAMMIGFGENDGEAVVKISWVTGAFETVEWAFSGFYDDSSGEISYLNCVKSRIVTNEKTLVPTVEILYENGTGVLSIDPETYKIRWQDDAENAGSACNFMFYHEPVPMVLDGVSMYDSEESVVEALGEPAFAENIEEDGRKFVYENIEIAGLKMKTTLFFSNGTLRAVDFANRDCGDQGRNDLSMFMDGFVSEIAAPTEAQVLDYAGRFTEIGDMTYPGWTGYFMKDGTLMLSVRCERPGVDLLLISGGEQG